MNIGNICGVTFDDAVGAFLVGLMLGALILWLAQRAFGTTTKGSNR